MNPISLNYRLGGIMDFISVETKQLMSELSVKHSVPLDRLMALAASAFADGLRYAMSQFPLISWDIIGDPTPEDI
jgi:hypothetical protein